MVCLQGKDIYLAALERQDCKQLWEDFEYDFDLPCEPLNFGSCETADSWFDSIQKSQGNLVHLGIFLPDGSVIGDVQLCGIDWHNRSASLGMGIQKIENRCKGYGRQALQLILQYAFRHLGLERIAANTLNHNLPAQKSLEHAGFVLEGRERQAVYLNGRKYDRFCYAILQEDFLGYNA